MTFVLHACQTPQEPRFQSDYFAFATEEENVEFKTAIELVPDYVDENMFYYCRTGVYDGRQIVYKGVRGPGLVLDAYQTTEARTIWNSDIPDHRYIAEIIVPAADEALLFQEFINAVDQKFCIAGRNVVDVRGGNIGIEIRMGVNYTDAVVQRGMSLERYADMSISQGSIRIVTLLSQTSRRGVTLQHTHESESCQVARGRPPVRCLKVMHCNRLPVQSGRVPPTPPSIAPATTGRRRNACSG
jgi:hypothetical protein